MPKIYATGDALNAVDYNEVIKTTGGYAATSSGNDTYVFDMPVDPGSYAEGDTYHVKFDVANTGPATVNISTLGAKDLLRASGDVLATGDIIAGMHAIIKYDGTAFRILTPLASNKSVEVITNASDTYSLTTIANEQVIVFAKGYNVGDNNTAHTVSLKYNGVTKDSVSCRYTDALDTDAFSLMYTETPGAATHDITVDTTRTANGASVASVVMIIIKIRS